MLLADVTKDYSASVLRRSNSMSNIELTRRFKPLIAAAQRDLTTEGFDKSRQAIQCRLDVRYVGQSYEITIPFREEYRREFDSSHHRLYGYSDPRRPTEIVNLRVVASGLTEKPALPQSRERVSRPRPASVRPARFNGRDLPTRFYIWEHLTSGSRANGPAVVTGPEATTVIPPGLAFRVDRFGNLIIRR
jgi:N-methylhydantoinase A